MSGAGAGPGTGAAAAAGAGTDAGSGEGASAGPGAGGGVDKGAGAEADEGAALEVDVGRVWELEVEEAGSNAGAGGVAAGAAGWGLEGGARGARTGGEAWATEVGCVDAGAAGPGTGAWPDWSGAWRLAAAGAEEEAGAGEAGAVAAGAGGNRGAAAGVPAQERNMAKESEAHAREKTVGRAYFIVGKTPVPHFKGRACRGPRDPPVRSFCQIVLETVFNIKDFSIIFLVTHFPDGTSSEVL